METLIHKELATNVFRSFGSAGGGSINDGHGYTVDGGKQVFVKLNFKDEARRLFDGEYAGLFAMQATNTVRVPKPIKVLDNPQSGAVLIMEHLDMHTLRQHSARLGLRRRQDAPA
ncbi:PREDICTED: ketosamine-3-kinase-like [Priapulus caudatus]|uniref:protein-ribulosamine 3-kinase n=1 Tax=Priapulus caudatus TaxID=37621 RepID=A0ABM1EU56_PRICU|nr:PREDICTED: ketosamine-3-kinase-like [Priapulus caudatus]